MNTHEHRTDPSGKTQQEHAHLAHPNDRIRPSDHDVPSHSGPIAEVIHIAKQNDSWFDSNTGEGQQIPGDDAAKIIPEDIHDKADFLALLEYVWGGDMMARNSIG
ncbi:MAG: hypothetical protein F6K19_19340 [Cyanothece sp. SIO1E1]|nr:hypothetical protein [Cyanothece sp. SIO1E1]